MLYVYVSSSAAAQHVGHISTTLQVELPVICQPSDNLRHCTLSVSVVTGDVEPQHSPRHSVTDDAACRGVLCQWEGSPVFGRWEPPMTTSPHCIPMTSSRPGLVLWLVHTGMSTRLSAGKNGVIAAQVASCT